MAAALVFGSGFLILMFLIFGMKGSPDHESSIEHQMMLANFRKTHSIPKLSKITDKCKAKFDQNIGYFSGNNTHPDKPEILIYILATRGSLLYLRLCGVRVSKAGINFCSKTPADVLNTITNDSFLLFLLGEDIKKLEIIPSGKHKELAVHYYKNHFDENGVESTWEKLRIDIFTFIHNVLIDRHQKIAKYAN